MKILLLEDNQSDAGLTLRALKKSLPDCEVEHVTTLQEARESLSAQQNFDIALLDMELPDGNGMNILMEIRQKQLDMAVAMLTGSGDEEIATAALKAGADDYMVKQSGYVSKIPQLVEFAIDNHKSIQKRESCIIHVLHIEHNIADVDLTNRYLSRYAPYIRTKNVPTGEAALKILPEKETEPEKWNYQVILMDYRLPGMSALEFIKEIRQERKLDVPIIIVTGHGNEEVAVQALKIGASDYLVKRENYLTRLPSLISGAFEHFELKRKQIALAESETKYRLLFESNPHPMWVYELETLRFLEANHAATVKYGYSRDEFLSMTLKDIRPQEDIDKLYENVRQSADEFTFSGEWRHKKRNGEIFLVEIISHRIKYNEKNARLVLANDINERKQTENKLKLYTRAIEQSPVSLNITDSNGNIVYVNSGFTALSGYSADEVFGKKPSILKSGIHTDKFYKELWETISAGNNWSGELCNRKKNGDLYWTQSTISPVVDPKGRITHFVAVKEDITERKKFIEDLKIAKEKAEESDRLKSAFLANMSHEIRTPMNGILGFTSLLLEPDLNSKEKEHYIEIVHKSGQRMLNTVTDIVEISKIEAGIVQIVQKETDVNKTIAELVVFFKPEAEKKGLQLNLNELLPDSAKKLITDQNKLDSILTNLIKNAIKYTDSGTINLGCRMKDTEIEFYVKDTGIGIPVHRQNAIFERFMQADIADTRVFEGSGLGLAIAKSYVEMLGGNIWVESKESLGSTFYFTLPASKIENKKTDIEKELSNEVKNKKEKPTKRKLKILIAEDDETSRNYISLILKDYCAELLETGTGIETVELCRNHKDIDLILMDIQMPGINGYEATRQIREFNKEVVIIAQTAFALSGDREKAIEAGCNDYISKPINKTKLQTLIQKYFGK
ncbi:response regulator [Roseimarinus sediminis]|uniref:response regulator n=1 Tax=Roseimarinus sediminis TaxID=1610899 RepID=UPI003D215F0D